MRTALELTFKGSEFDLVPCESASAALEKVKTERPDLIITDVSLPPSDGYELCTTIKLAAPELPILLLSSKHNPFDPTKGAQADGHIDKPFDTQVLLDKVAELLEAAAERVPDTDIPLSYGRTPGQPVSAAAKPPSVTGAAAAAPTSKTVPGLGEDPPSSSQPGAQRIPSSRRTTPFPAVEVPADTAMTAAARRRPKSPRGLMETMRMPGPGERDAAKALLGTGGPRQGIARSPEPAPIIPMVPDSEPAATSPKPPVAPDDDTPELVFEAEPDTAPRKRDVSETLPGVAAPPDGKAPPASAGPFSEVDKPTLSPLPEPPPPERPAPLGVGRKPRRPTVSSWPAPPKSDPPPPPVIEPLPPVGEDLAKKARESKPPSAVQPTAEAMGDLASRLADLGLTKEQVEGVLAISQEVIERVAWEVVPTLAETIIKEELARLTKPE